MVMPVAKTALYLNALLVAGCALEALGLMCVDMQFIMLGV
jgi:hypothetical protein